MNRLWCLASAVLCVFAWGAEAATSVWCERGEVATDGNRIVHDDSFVSPTRLCARPFGDPFKPYELDEWGFILKENEICEEVDSGLNESRHPDVDGDYVVFVYYGDGKPDIFVHDPKRGDPPYYNLTNSDKRVEDFPAIEGKTVAFQVWDDEEFRWYVDVRKLDRDDFEHEPIGDPARRNAFPTVNGEWVFYESTPLGAAAPLSTTAS